MAFPLLYADDRVLVYSQVYKKIRPNKGYDNIRQKKSELNI